MRPCAVRAVPGRVLPALLLVGLLIALATPGTAGAQIPALPIVVNDTADRPDRSIGDGTCATGQVPARCTLRAAIQEANALIGHNTIVIPGGVYEIEIPTLNEDLPGTGDHDIADTLTIEGAGASATILDGGFPLPSAPVEARGIDRLFEIHPTAGDVTMVGLTIRNGFSEESGGAIENWSPGTLSLESVHLLDNLASKEGGAINNNDPFAYPWPTGSLPPQATIPSGRVELVDSTLSGNSAGSGGAAINNVSNGSISIHDSHVTDNPGEMIPDPLQVIDPLDPEPIEFIPGPGVYQPVASAIVNEGEFDGIGTITVTESVIARNYVPPDGAGINNAGDGIVVVDHSTIEDNTTEGNGGAIYTNGGKLTVTNSTITENLAHANGGGIYGDGNTSSIGLRAKLTIKDSTFSKNEARAESGGIHSDGDGEAVITDVLIKDNKATEDAGGGLSVHGRSSLLLARANVTGNFAYSEGGGLFTASERPQIVRDSAFSDNSAGVPGLEGNDAGGGGVYTEGGPVEITGTTIFENTGTAEGGGISIDNHGQVDVRDTVVRDNSSLMDGGGVENSGAKVTFQRVMVRNNKAVMDGGGIHNSSSGEYTVLDTTMRENKALNGGGFTNASDSTLVMRSSLIYNNVANRPPNAEDPESGGYGGGFYSVSDGGGIMENTTISHNKSNVRGGGMYHDADAEFKIVNTTIWRNKAPFGGGLSTVETDFVPTIPPQPNPLVLKNTIVAGSLEGGSCDWYVTSEGGNLSGPEHKCFISVPGSDLQLGGVRDRQGANPALDALADNGGATLTHAPRYGSLAIDNGVGPCPETDARGVSRPQNGRCDTGAFEFVGPPPPADVEPPDTQYISGPVQDSLETNAFHFTGTDDVTPVEELIFECRLIEHDLTEAPEPQSPFEAVDPMFIWQSCSSGWQTELLEEGLFSFEVRAVDRAGREDETPAVHTFNGSDLSPPDTMIVEKPPLTTTSRAAVFTFTGVDNGTPAPFLEYECRLDSRDPEMWLECFNPAMYSNLTTGQHTLEVRAFDGAEQMDPTPARYTWTVGAPTNCDNANVTLTPTADGWVDEVNPVENYLFETELEVRSGATGDPTAQPPEQVIGQNARTLVRFPVPTVPNCELESATMRLWADGMTEGRMLEARPLAASFKESTLTWVSQPGVLPGDPATTEAGEGYREWDVLDHVNAMAESGVNHGWQIRDSVENDQENGGDQSFASRETPQDPPEVTLPELKLRYVADSTPAPDPPTMNPGTTPTTVQCGQVITEDTIVANDLDNCPGEGLVVAASDVVLDLNGHTIDGPDFLLENASGQEEGFPAGIRVSGRSNVIVRNGTVQQFGWGVLVTAGTVHSVLDNLKIYRHAVAGVEFFDADDGRNGNTIQNSTIEDNELGVFFQAGSENSVIRNNEINGNLGEQILLLNSDGNLIEGNSSHGIPSDPLLDSDGGVMLEGSSDNVMRNNTVHDTGDAGVMIHMGSHRNTVDGGLYYRNGDAGVIINDSNGNKVLGITSHQQSDGGVVLNNAHNTEVRGTAAAPADLRFNPSGVEAGNTNNLLIQHVDASDSLQTGLELGNGVGIRVLDNIVHGAGGAGIGLEGGAFDALGAPVGGAVIARNRTDQNGESGISVADAGHTIRDNEAYNNSGFGINAGENPELPGQPFPGTNIDGGGNKASGNAELEQCSGVVCLTGSAPPLTPPDTTGPDTLITQAPSDPSGGDVTFHFTANDETTDGAPWSPPTAMEFACRLDPLPDPPPEPVEPDLEPPEPGQPPDIDSPPEGEGWVECTSPVTFKGLDEGMHHFEVRATDFADLEDLSPATHDWMVELVPEEEPPGMLAPETRIASGPPSETTSHSANFSFAGSDDTTPGLNLTYECKLDPPGAAAGAWGSCTTPTGYTGLELGTHNFEVRAIDRGGSADPTPAAQTWTIIEPPVDITPPETTIDSGPDRTTVQTNAGFTFSSEDPDATFECKLNTAGSDWAACTSPHELTGVPVGLRVLEVRAVDAAGNADPTPATYDWNVSGPPVPTFVHCGMKVTHSVLVRNDLVDCLWDGLVVDADGITIDLDGHTIDGKGLGAGVRNVGFDNVTIKNGRLRDFDWGVALNTGTRRNVVENLIPEMTQEAAIGLGHLREQDPALPVEPPDPFPSADSGVRDNVVRNNTIIGNSRGVWLTANTQGTVIENNQLTATSDDAIWLERSHNNTVKNNEINASSGAGVALEGSNNNTVADNDLEANNGGVRIDVTATPPVDQPSNDNRVERNLIEESGGLEVIESERNLLIDNVVKRANSSGVELDFARDGVVKGNDLRTNKNGVALKNSTGNRIELNDASDSEGTGITMESQSFDNELIRNQSSNNDGDGIYVGDETPGGSGTLIEGNTTNNNKGYGIYVPKPAHIIKGNSANDNGGWGIYSGVPSNGRSNVDAGGNRGQGNLGPLDPITLMPQQCHLVDCAGDGPISADIVPPDTQIIEAPSNPSDDNVALFRFTGTDNASDVTFQCSLDGIPETESFTPCTSPAVFDDLALGQHNLKVRSVDASGNVDLSPATHVWTVGQAPTAPPETTIDIGPDLTTVQTSAEFEFSSSKRNSTFLCRVDSAAFAPCAWSGNPFALIGTKGTFSIAGPLSVGTHTFEVQAIDAAGTPDSTPAAFTWRITAAPVSTPGICSTFVTQSIRLTSDMLDCPGVGLIVGASDITIDLNGHVIDGTGLDAGVLINGHDSVTVTGGHIHEFDYGVQLNPGSSLNVVHSLRVENNQEAGIGLSDADQDGLGNTIRNNTITGNSYGIGLFSGTRHAVIRDNDLASNFDDAVHLEQSLENQITNNEIVRSNGAAVFMQGGANNTVTDNVMTLNGQGVVAGEELIPSNDNLVQRNTIEESGGPGVAVNDSTGTQVINNDVRDSNGAGVALDLARETLVRGNDLRGNGGGVELSESRNNRIELNNAGGTVGTGISLEGLSFGNDVINNGASGNGGEGIEVADSAPAGEGNLIQGNTADSNGGDGIIVEGAGHTLTNNSAQLNGGWGMYAPVGVIDGGGNFAAGNIEPGQCLGVVCTIGAAPGEPQTTILDKPPLVSNSRNASFTYIGKDDSTPLVNLVFECRLDTTNDLAWEDCEYPHEIHNLSPGQHRLDVRAVDLGELPDSTPASYTWTYEPLPANDPPEVSIDMHPEAESWALDALFTFHANEPDVTMECKVDLWEWEQCGFDTVAHMNRGGFEWGLDETEVGLHTFYVRATDFEGNVGPATTFNWRLLGVVTQFLSGPGFTPGTEGEPATGGEVQSSSATIDFQANVADATYECSLDLEPFTPCTSPLTYTGLLAGDHMLQVVATDVNGIAELEAAVYEWEILEPFDNTPPETTLELAPPDNSSSTKFEFAGTDDQTPPVLLTFECRIDSTNELDWEPCENPYNLLDHYTYADFQLAPGPHRFEVRAVDAFEPLVPDPANPDFEGNVDPTPVVYEWTSVADTEAPGTGIAVGPTGKTAETEALFEFFGTDNATPAHLVEFECKLDAEPWEPCSTPDTISPALPGVHTLQIRGIDIAGNVDQTPAERTWEIVAAPIAEIISGPPGRILPGQSGPPAPSTSDRGIFTFTSNDPNGTFECSLDGSEFLPCTSPHAAWLVESGAHEFAVRGVSPFTTVDGEPIVQEEPTTYEWEVVLGPDQTRPDTTITSGPGGSPGGSTLDSIATFEFTGSDNRTPANLLTFECSLDGGLNYSSCTSPEQFSDMTHATHELLVRATDVDGNIDLTPARYEWTVALPPVVTIHTGPDEVVESTSATFTFSSNVPGSSFKCWLDVAMVDCNSPVTYNNLAAGEHVFAVLATTPQGITGLQWEEWEWIVGDATAPITTFHSGPDFTTEETSATFTFSADESNATFTCSLDGREPEPCTSPLEFPRLHPGAHVLTVEAHSPPLFDVFGRPVEPDYDPIPATYQWTVIDTEAPNTSIDWGPQPTTSSLSAVFGLSSDDPTAIIECSLDGQGYSECDPVMEFTELERGPHTLQARAVDLVGNVDQTPAEHNWTITEPGPPNTPAGTNVTIELPMPDGPGTASVNFFQVTQPGTTELNALTGGPELPAGYSAGGARFYDFSTTAEFGEPAMLCLSYDPARYQTTAVRLLQSDGSAWLDVTTLNNPFIGRICVHEAEIGQGESAIFAVAAANSGIAPLVSILSGPPPVTTSGTATFEFFADMNSPQVMCSLDGLPYEPCTSPVTYTHLESGDHNLQVQAVSPFGIPTIVPTLYEWEVILPPDVTDPITTITKAPPAMTGSLINWIEFTGFDDQTHVLELEFECAIDGGVWESCDVPHEVEVLTVGPHWVEVRAIDETLNFDETPARADFTVVDVSAPDTSIDTGPESETTETTASFTFTGEEETGEPVFEFECALDNEDFVPCSNQPYTITGVTGGPHVMQVRAVDPDGNPDPTPDFYEWLVIAPVDTTPPDTIIFSGPAEGALTGPDVLFAFISNELVEEFECSLDGAAFQSCESLYELVGLSTGQHTLRVRALDLAEPPNVDPSPAVRTWNVLGEPQTTITAHPPAETTSASGTFHFTSDQAGVTFECAVDGSVWVPCTSGFIAGPLAAGDPESGEQHEFEVRAVSPYRNIDGEQIIDLTPARYTWTVFPLPDPPAFDTEITAHPPTATAGGPDAIYLFNFIALGPTPNMAAFECSLDGEPFDGCEPPVEYDALPAGEHTFRVRAVDPAEQPDASPATFTWTIEPAPETTLSTVGLPPLEVESTTQTFTFGSPDAPAGSTFECAFDTPVFSPCSSPQTYNNIPHGDHEFQVRAKSPAGSVDQTPAIHEWTSGDMTPPIVTIDSAPTLLSGPEQTTASTTATFAFSSDDPEAEYMCSLNGAPDPVPVSHQPTFCNSGSVTYENLVPGLPYEFTVEPVKEFLLVSAEPAVWEWTISDTVAPTASIVSGPAEGSGVLPEEPVIFTLSSNEPWASFECALDTLPGEEPSWGSCAEAADPRVDYSGLAAGQHTLLVRAVDLADPPNAGPPVSRTWTVTGPPTTTLLTGPTPIVVEPTEPGTTEARTATFTFEANQPNVTFACQLDGPTVLDPVFEPCSSGVNYTGLAAGEYEFTIQATNEFDMVEQPAVTHLWTITDTGAPETTIELGPHAASRNTTATFTFSSNESDASYECALDTPASSTPSWNSCAQPPENTATFADLAVGDHNLLVRAVDPSGNFDATPAEYHWTVAPSAGQNTPTGASVTVSTDAPGGTTTATVNFSQVTGAGSTALDPLGPGTSPLPLGYLPTGAQFYELGSTATYLEVTSVCLTYDMGSPADPVRMLHFDGSVWTDVTTTDNPDTGTICGDPGNLGAFALASATTAVVPDTSISSAPSDPTVKTFVEFGFEADSNTPVDPATFECALDTLPGEVPSWSSCEATQLFEGLLPGEHVLLVRAVNEFGMFDATPARHEWTQDSLDTFIDETAAPPEATESRTATFHFSSDYPGATFECLLDDEIEYSPCSATTVYNDLIDGDHELVVRAVTPDGDADETPAEWSWEIGEVPQTVTIDSHPDPVTEDGVATFTFSAPIPGETFECSIDGGPFSICSSPKTYQTMPVGVHTFRVQTFSPDPIVEQVPTEFTWEVQDNAAPQTNITFGPPAVTGNNQANFTFSSSETLLRYECSLNNAAYSPCDDSVQYSNLALGDYNLRVRAVDLVGNVDDSPATHEWSVVARPETTVLGPEVDPLTTTSATFTFSSDQPGSTFECALDGGPFEVCTSPHELTNLASGEHTLFVRARNAQGVEDIDPAEWQFMVELPPDTTIVTHPAAISQDTNASFTFGSNEAEVSFECALDTPAGQQPTWTECVNPHAVFVLPGDHELLVRAIDSASQVDASPASYSWHVDPIAPQTTITDVTAGSVIFHFEADEPGVYFECSLDGADFAECVSPVRYTDLDAGQHTFEVRAVDLAGNIDLTPARYSWAGNAPDETAPETTLETRLDPVTQANEASFNFEAESGATFECSLDSSAWEPCEAPREYAGLDAGSHTFEVRAVDGAYNRDPSPASYSWTIDVSAPDTILETRLDPVTESNEASFNFEADEPDARFECSLDQGDWESCVAPREYTGLSVGNHEFRARAVDQAGNADASPASYEWTIEPPSVVAPETTIASQPDATTTSSNAGFEFSSDVAGSTFECSLDSSAWEACSSPAEYTGLALGGHEFKVRATDPAGTPDGSPASYSWTVEAPPNCSTAPLIAAAAADSWNGQTAASTNHGTEATMRVISRQAQRARALVRFANPELPNGCEIESATMRLYASTVKSGRTLQAQRLGGPWTETGVTWNTQPTATGAIASAPSLSTAGYVEWDVTEQVEAMYDSGSNHGFLIRDAVETAGSNQEQRFASRETTTGNVPELVITLASPAPPDTTAPETTLGSGAPGATTTSTSASFSFSSNESDASFDCALDAGSYAPCTSPKDYADLAVGAHEFRVRAVDAAGNVDDSPATHSWTVEAPPAPVCDGTPTIAPALADAWNGQLAPTTNHGADTVLRVNARSGQRDRTLIKFDNPVVAEGCTVTSATLRLYSSSFKSGRTLQALRLGGSWAEGGVNWNSQPMPSGAAASAPSRSSAGWVEWTVTAQVQAMYAAGSNHGFLIRDANEGGSTNHVQEFDSRETASGNAPQLVLTIE